MAFDFDQTGMLSENWLTIVSPKLAHVAIGWMYAVTTDGGCSWHVWDARRDLVGWECCNFELIGTVELDVSGRGVMRLNVIDDSRGEVPCLVTTDHGVTWTRPTETARVSG